MECTNIKPDLFASKNALVLTYFNPETPQGGSSALMRNFLSNFNRDSFEIVCATPRRTPEKSQFQVHALLTDIYLWKRPLQRLLWKWVLQRDVNRVQKFIDSKSPDYVFLIYPHGYNVEVFLSLKLPRHTKVVAYFHDTFVEGQLTRINKHLLLQRHEKLLSDLDVLFVMNKGMERLYQDKYQTNAIALEHCFPEFEDFIQAQTSDQKALEDTLFWGGNIVGYNSNSVARIMEISASLGLNFEVASGQSQAMINQLVQGKPFIKSFYERPAYLEAVQSKQFLILSLDWPDETDYHFDEIATIFSTKTIEYLMSGRPIILHCHEQYFMADFFNEHKCGYVLSTRDMDELEEQVRTLMKADHKQTLENALKAAEKFSPKTIVGKYQQALSVS